MRSNKGGRTVIELPNQIDAREKGQRRGSVGNFSDQILKCAKSGIEVLLVLNQNRVVLVNHPRKRCGYKFDVVAVTRDKNAEMSMRCFEGPEVKRNFFVYASGNVVPCEAPVIVTCYKPWPVALVGDCV